MTAIPGPPMYARSAPIMFTVPQWAHRPGAVLRCPACDGVVLRVVETVEATYVDARGAAFLRFERR